MHYVWHCTEQKKEQAVLDNTLRELDAQIEHCKVVQLKDDRDDALVFAEDNDTN